MKRFLCYLLFIAMLQSCAEDENVVDKSQLTLGIWYYEYEPNSIFTSTTLVFNIDGTYRRENAFYARDVLKKNVKEGKWIFLDNNIIDLTDFGICVQPVDGPPCVPPDVDFKVLQLKKDVLEIEELVNDEPTGFLSKRKYINIKP